MARSSDLLQRIREIGPAEISEPPTRLSELSPPAGWELRYNIIMYWIKADKEWISTDDPEVEITDIEEGMYGYDVYTFEYKGVEYNSNCVRGSKPGNDSSTKELWYNISMSYNDRFKYYPSIQKAYKKLLKNLPDFDESRDYIVVTEHDGCELVELVAGFYEEMYNENYDQVKEILNVAWDRCEGSKMSVCLLHNGRNVSYCL